MNIMLFGTGAFGYAMLKHISDKTEYKIYAYDQAEFTMNFLQKYSYHPYFFEGIQVPSRVVFTKSYKEVLPDIDVIIITIPCQSIPALIDDIKAFIKKGVIFVNLSKGINNISLKTISEEIADRIPREEYEYAVLSGGMIASEVIHSLPLGADIAISNVNIQDTIDNIFTRPHLKTHIFVDDIKQIELVGALKNVISIVVGYYIGKGYASSSIGLYFADFYKEFCNLIAIFSNSPLDLDFSSYALGGDVIASIFGDSRNKLFGKLLGEGLSIDEILLKMKEEKKTAEGYYTLKGVYNIVKDRPGFEIINMLGALTKC